MSTALLLSSSDAQPALPRAMPVAVARSMFAARVVHTPSTSGRTKGPPAVGRRGEGVSANAVTAPQDGTSRRAAFLGGVASVCTGVALLTPNISFAADVASFVSLDAIITQVRDAADELELVDQALRLSVQLGTAPPLREMRKRLASGALSDLPAAATRLDRFIDAPDLQDWEQVVWSSVSEETRGSRDTNAETGKRLGGVERTNDFLCFVFSCFNDPRAPPSTDALLSLRLLSDGIGMGLRGDTRITSQGLTYSVQDVREKLNAYVALVEKSRLKLN